MVRVLQKLLGAVVVVSLLGLASLGQNGELSEDIPNPSKVVIYQLFQIALAEQNSHVRYAIAQAIKEADPQGMFALPELARLLDVLKEEQDTDRLVWVLGLVREYNFGNQAELAEDIAPKLIHFLDSENQNVRQAAAEALGNIGPTAKEAVPKLIELLGDSNSGVRQAAAEALGQIGPAAQRAVPMLIELLDDWISDVRQAAAEALGNIGPTAKEAVPKLIELLGDSNSGVRQAAAEALEKIGPASPDATEELKELLGHSSLDVRQAAAAELEELGTLSVNDLIELLESRYGDVRAFAAELLGKIGPSAQRAVPKLIGLLGDWKVQQAAAEALEKIGPASPDATEELKDLLEHSDWEVRQAAAAELEKLGTLSVNDLIELLESRYGDVRAFAAKLLGKFGPDAQDAVDKLIALLADYDSNVRRAAAEALGKIGPAAQKAVPKLIELIEDSDSDVRRAAATALAQIYRLPKDCSREVANVLIRHKEDEDPEVREAVRSAWLAASSCFIAEEVTKYLTILIMPDPALRKRAIEMLGWIGPAANPKAVAPLLEVLKTDPDPDIRVAAARALAKILAPQD